MSWQAMSWVSVAVAAGTIYVAAMTWPNQPLRVDRLEAMPETNEQVQFIESPSIALRLDNDAPSRQRLSTGASSEVSASGVAHWQVMRVLDGDTVVVANGLQTIRVRLSRIDAPEKDQAGGKESTDYLNQMVMGKMVHLQSTGKDKYGRTLGELSIGGESVNAKMVETGWALHYTKYAPNDQALADLQSKAKARRAGVWNENNPVAPWDHRHGPGLGGGSAVKEMSRTSMSGSQEGSVYFPSSTSAPKTAGNGDVLGADNDGDGRAETVFVKGYMRNGVKVPSSYRAAPAPRATQSTPRK